MYFNLLALAAFSLYDFKTDITKQTAIAYTSTIITFILLVGVVIYHMTLFLKKKETSRSEEVNEYEYEYRYPLSQIQPTESVSKITHTVIEIPKTPCVPPEPSCDETIHDQDITESDGQ